MKKIHVLLSAVLCTMIFLNGCTKETTAEKETAETVKAVSDTIVSYDSNDLDEDYSDESPQTITLSKNKITCDGKGTDIDATTITIKEAGTYVFKGTLQDGNIIINAGNNDMVRIVLDNASITSSTTAPLYVKQADKVLLTLAANSKNSLQDASAYQLENIDENEPNAAVFSKDDLTINGNGSLNVTAQYNNGIQSKDDLKIVNGTIDVQAVDNGLVGKDLLAIRDGDITVTAQGDGLRATNTEDSKAGIVSIEGGTISIDVQQDGIQSENELYVYAGTLTITAGNGNTNGTKIRSEQGFNPFEQPSADSEDTISMKGMKAANRLTIKGGTIIIDSADDALHSNSDITITGGTIKLSSGDDAIHSDKVLTIKKGTIDILTSYEGLEAETITINGGKIHVKASDDGVNASGSTPLLEMKGGYLYVYADGDGLDSNGDIQMSGGTMIVNGTQSGGNGILDFDGSFEISGGTLVACGSKDMLQYPDSVSNGNMAVIAFDANMSDMLHLQNQNGDAIITYQPDRSYQVITIYTDKIQSVDTIQIYTGGSASVTQDGIYDDMTYSNGTLYDEFSVSDTTSIIGSISSMGGGPGGMGGGGGFH